MGQLGSENVDKYSPNKKGTLFSLTIACYDVFFTVTLIAINLLLFLYLPLIPTPYFKIYSLTVDLLNIVPVIA